MSVSLLVILAFVVAFLASFASTPFARELAYKIGAIDVPKDARRMHKIPTPRLGGIAIFLGFIIALVCFVILTPEIIGIVIASLIIVLMGMIDDKKPIKAWQKLLVQIVCALIVAVSGVKIEVFTNPNLFSSSDYLLLGKLSIPVTVIWIVIITNAVNLIDGLDGLAAGVASISSVCLLVISLMVSESNIAVLTACLAGACFGFLPYNFNPASIFMGDSGSNFLGFMLACISIEGLFKGYAVISFAVPLLLLALPIFDTSVAILRRIKNKKPVMAPDRGHLHHKLVDMGFSQKQAVLILYTISAVLGLAAIVFTGFGALRAIMLLCAALAGMLISIYFFKERTSSMIKVMTIFGTRPEAIKMAPLIKELESRKEINSVVAVTAQHRQMLDQVLKIFDILPNYDLDIMKERQTLVSIVTGALEGLDEIMKKENPDIVLVHGDTSTTFVGALAAFYNQIAVGHVEAGLRTYDKYSPFPEEMNRKLTGQMTDMHFSPTVKNKNNLLREDMNEDDIYITGNTVIDALKTTVRDDYEFVDKTLKSLDFEGKRVILVTAHRRENLGRPLENICEAIKEIAVSYDDIEIVYPIHMNPAVREVAHKILDGLENVHIIEPLDVEELHNAMNRCYMVMTDSGGIQEEAPSLKKPVLVLRTETERPEAVEAGTVKIAGVEKDVILKMAKELLDDETAYAKMAKAANPYGDGLASKRIVDAIIAKFNNLPKPEDFIS